ncbi:Rne/Rng family ribonuclease [Varunaivibrio sulfuroxidans]|uniref:Rne/Rng family ribonuclease n=1 Tax=Varunaivibrio sulfuroxidans TaxID=1773489 RepID=UPI002AC31A5C|nr:Rne/Rng family ribonuclease [Varunaivibrio sulfuroxidans]
MSTKRMLIDATHPEETRVVVADGTYLEDFDVEVASRRQLKGNIYLAKIIRVEPSLQAAFVDYGGNRHGFLAFSEIHPDYYQIPVSDRETTVEPAHGADEGANETSADEAGSGENGGAEDVNDHNGDENDNHVETLGGDDTEADDEDLIQNKTQNDYRRYKIQEVIKRRQIILVQVVKEERGNKGAALTTYISLAGRYCVLMPNTARGGGGISRKITNSADRKHLKGILNDLSIPDGMAVIVRTAGIQRSKAEIKRDYEYLLRLWDQVRERTLESTAPTLVHEESDLIRRSIRDLYSRDISEILVEGDAAYRHAKDFMKLLIPSHARRVKQYKDEETSLFRAHGIEDQLDAIHNPIVQLKSGGYIVINPTEALVAIDVNSGRSTKERNIEETALKTNLEAADEAARQVKLRDLAGLVVIDFIDMDVRANNGQVERRIKEAMKNDRARIQLGRISPFGLLELSRQRLRPSLIETSSEPCPHCEGTGVRRSTDSTALTVLRAIEEEGSLHRASEIAVYVPTDVALYILNNKRKAVADIETRCALKIVMENDDTLIPPALRIERTKAPTGEVISEMVSTTRRGDENAGDDGAKKRRRRPRRRKSGEDGDSTEVETPTSNTNATHGDASSSDDDKPENAAEGVSTEASGDGEDRPKRRRRGRRGGRRRGRKDGMSPSSEGEGKGAPTNEGEDGADARRTNAATPLEQDRDATAQATPGDDVSVSAGDVEIAENRPEEVQEQSRESAPKQASEETQEAPKPKRQPRKRRAPTKKATTSDGGETTTPEAAQEVDETEAVKTEDDQNGEEKPKRRRSRARPQAAAKTAARKTSPRSLP